MAAIDDDLLGIMACPFCRSAVRLDAGRICCLNPACGCRYPIRDEIPVMLIDEADRPCPSCGAQRDWDEGDVLACPRCGTRLEAQRDPPLGGGAANEAQPRRDPGPQTKNP